MKKYLYISIFTGVLFFVIYLFTLKDYGISWDSATHFKRGQAYIHYFLTGRTNYDDVKGKRSIYQNEIQDGKFWLKDTSGHPPLNDDIAAFFNYIFYQKLGILGDVEAYNFFIVLVSSLVIFIITYFVGRIYGLLAGVIAGFILGFYPLFFAESHFNIKDPVETAFFTITIILFVMTLEKWNWKTLILSFCFFGCALATKFDALFVPFIIVPYLIIRFRKKKVIIPRNFKLAFIGGICIALFIFYLSWPALWGAGMQGFSDVINFYKGVGTGANYQPNNYYFLGVNFYPVLGIIYTTPPFVLLFAIFGTYKTLKDKNKNKKSFGILFLIWFIVSIARVSLPNTSIYGGLRQIMQYVPALSVLAAIGIGNLKNTLLKTFLLIILIISVIQPVLKYHPNENVYFNFLVGGLAGAKEKNIPSWGNSFGNVYKQGVDWININSEPNSSLTVLQGELINAPKIWVRKDINYSKDVYSGKSKLGEYIMEMNFNDTANAFGDKWKYVREELKPVYEVKVDTVPILIIWKNDKLHSF